MLASWFALASSLAASAPVGDTFADPVAPVPKPLSARIDTIEILRHGALEGAKVLTVGDSMVYRMAEWLRDNVLHSRTSETTIRKRLIVETGDSADSVRLKEAGRLLRTERFLAEAKVDTFRLSDDRLALRAETWDRWSTAIIGSLNRSGGEYNWQLGLREANLLGTGQDVGFSYASTALRRGWLFNYANTAMFVPGGQLLATYVDQSDGHNLFGSFGYPNRSRYQTWAWNLEFQDMIWTRRVLATPSVRQHFETFYGADFIDDALFCSQPDSRYRLVRGSIGKLWGESVRLGLSAVAETELDSTGATVGGFTVDKDKVDAAKTDPIFLAWRAATGHRDDRRLGAAVSLRGIDHVRKQNFNQLKWTEDIPLGWEWTATYLFAVLSRGDIRDDAQMQTTASWTAMTGNVYHSMSAAWKSFMDGSEVGQGSSTARLELRWLPSTRFQTIGSISNASVFGAPVYQSQLSLGEDNGLPGYSARALTGRGRFLSTGEIRWTPPLEAFTVAPAVALFAGTGRVSDQPFPSGDAAWKTGIGFGLRFGMTRSPNGLVNHLSFSRPIGDPDNKSWMFSFGAKQSL